jgi:glycosyltransferase involved in cell wall biosynthesis
MARRAKGLLMSQPASSDHPRISACIITLNEEDRIVDCIRSVEWCDEVVVVDSHSTDRTRELAVSLGARVIERDWPGHVAQKAFATSTARHDWIFSIDADERVSPALREEILRLRDQGFPGKVGWWVPRMSCYLGRWIRHGTWYPDWCLRLFDRRRGRWGGYDPHDRFEADGPTGRLFNDLLHYPYRSLGEHLHGIDSYTTIMARGMYERGQRASLADLVFRPWIRFVRFYVLRAGFLDGWRGLLLAYLAAHYVRMKYAKLLVMQKSPERAAAPPSAC